MTLRVAKAHGLGNDFLLVDREAAPLEPSVWVPRICDRHTGVGADGVILFTCEGTKAVRMTLVNADGGEAEISGNGLRCLAAYVVARRGLAPTHTVITAAGPRAVEVAPVSDKAYRIVTDLGAPILEPVTTRTLEVQGQPMTVTVTSMGNPHCAVFLEAPASDEMLHQIGPLLEHHPAFPRRTNVEFVTPLSRRELRVRFWERGVGYTRASGTGAASAAVAAILNQHVDREVRVICDGGVLEVAWPEGGTVRQVGDVEIVFEGDWLGA
jgi:diaminopimelate epimerase